MAESLEMLTVLFLLSLCPIQISETVTYIENSSILKLNLLENWLKFCFDLQNDNLAFVV